MNKLLLFIFKHSRFIVIVVEGVAGESTSFERKRPDPIAALMKRSIVEVAWGPSSFVPVVVDAVAEDRL